MSDVPPRPDAGPRSFVTATGFVFQIVGLLLALGGCCLWSFSGRLQVTTDQPIHTVAAYFDQGHDGRMLAMVNIVTTFLGGFGLLASGLGLQGEHPRSGLAGMAASGVLTIGWIGTAVAYGAWAQLWGAAAIAGAVGVGALGLFLLAGNSARILREHPPDANRNVVTDEFIEAQRQKRRH